MKISKIIGIILFLNLTGQVFGAEFDSALVIIDMQPGFKRSERVIAAVCEEVQKCIQNKGHIVIIETKTRRRAFGDTYPAILEACRDYSFVSPRFKAQNGGSFEVLEALRSGSASGALPSVVRVVGGYAGQCLEQTVVGLSRAVRREESDMRIVIPTKAVYASRGTFWGWGHNFKGENSLYHVSLDETYYDDCYHLDFESLMRYAVAASCFALYVMSGPS